MDGQQIKEPTLVDRKQAVPRCEGSKVKVLAAGTSVGLHMRATAILPYIKTTHIYIYIHYYIYIYICTTIRSIYIYIVI